MRVLVRLGLVLHTYLLEVSGARSGRLRTYFDVGARPELDDFRRVVGIHPVFRVLG